MSLQEIVSTSLRLPLSSISYTITEELRRQFVGKSIIETKDSDFDLDEAVRKGVCELIGRDDLEHEEHFEWDMTDLPGVSRKPVQGFHSVRWHGYRFNILRATWRTDCGDETTYWIISEADEIGETFFRSVCELSAVVDDYVFVFENGYWDKSRDLFNSIKKASFENLVLDESLLSEIRRNVAGFFAAKERYEQYGVPWKRGLLLIGPPGNGKTHTVKALLNSIGVTRLYVKSLKARYSEHASMQLIFAKARQLAPCILVMEDLDSMIDKKNRSFFLNEMDGFAANNGILVLATTNHADKLDPAIVDRPSRFDRKYHFGLPDAALRAAFLRQWNGKMDTAMRLSDSGIENLAGATDGYSFAYLKELCIASTMRWIDATVSGGSACGMDEVALCQSAVLRDQMVTTRSQDADSDSEEDEDEDDD